MNSALIILNPAAGRGRARRLAPNVRRIFASVGVTELRETREAGEEETLVSEAVARGITTFIGVGGDGTCAHIANAILRSGTDSRLAVVPCGTGNDFAKTLGVANYQPENIATLVSKGFIERIDIGRADERYFLNGCGFGFDASVLAATKDIRILRGNAIYIYSALAQLFTYRGIKVKVGVDLPSNKSSTLMLTVSNGRFLGGVFQIAPDASVIDGELDVALFRDCNIFQRARLFAAALKGSHFTLPWATARRASKLSLEFAETPAMEIDGELRQASSATVTIECIPRALSVYAVPGAIR